MEQGLPSEEIDRRLLQQIILEQAKARYQVVPPEHIRRWEISMGNPAELRDKLMYIRFKFDPPIPGVGKTFPLARHAQKLAKLPVLDELFVKNVFCVLEKRGAAQA